jgi:putative peptidoglycan lipid II flippase
MSKPAKNLSKSALTIGWATLLSRLSGYLRDFIFAWVFGTSAGADAFVTAYRIPNLIRKLFGEGALSAAFIPFWISYRQYHGLPAAWSMFKRVARRLAFWLGIITLAGILAAPLLIRLYAWGFHAQNEQMALTVSLMRIMWPYIAIIGMAALIMAVLNSANHYLGPALVPLLLNGAVIFAIIWATPRLPAGLNPLLSPACGILLGGLLQLVVLWILLIAKHRHRVASSPVALAATNGPPLKSTVGTILGHSGLHLNLIVATAFATTLPIGSISSLYFADRLIQFPLGIVAIAASIAALPTFSNQAISNNLVELKDTYLTALNQIGMLTMPAMVGLIVLREPVVKILFEHGAFNAAATRLTVQALLYYAYGLWALAAIRVTVPVYYALRDTRLPALAVMLSLAANLIFAIILMPRLQTAGLALAVSLAALVQLAVLVQGLNLRLGLIKWSRLIESLVRSSLCSVLMGIGLAFMAPHLLCVSATSRWQMVCGLGLCIFLGMAIYGLISLWLQPSAVRSVLAAFRRSSKDL